MKIAISTICLACLSIISSQAQEKKDFVNASMSIQVDKAGVTIAPHMYGIFFEDINHAGDGGIYAEMVRNRSFEDIRPPEDCQMHGDLAVTPGNFKWFAGVKDSIPSWKLFKAEKAVASMHLDTINPLNKAQLYALRLDIKNAASSKVSIANTGYYGISAKKGENYKLSFYARTNAAQDLTVSLQDDKGTVVASSIVKSIGKNWKKYQLTLNAKETNHKLMLHISASKPGSIWFDMVSLFPENTFKKRENGLRADLMEQLKGMNPKFLRFPGGCVVEGITFENAIQWKETIGDIAERPGRVNLWGYRSTDGLGYHEFLQMSEDLNCEPLFVINVGMTCQARNSYSKPMSELQPMIQDALDAIEYANGPVSSYWGGLRAKHGHPAPFNLKYFEIGNENWGPDYDERYVAFYDAIKAKYPDIITIRAAHPTADKNPLFFPENKGEMLDLHYYRSPDWLFKNNNILDDYPRIGKKLYIGEFACNEKVGTGNLLSALADASFMMAFERNGDIVELASYAPLLEHEDKEGYKWPVNMIHFNNHQIYAIPSYFVQQMFANNLGDVTLAMDFVSDSVSVPTNVKLEGGAIGFDTYSTEAEFDDVVVTSGNDTLYFENFSKESKFPLQVSQGNWKIENGVLRQSDASLFAHAIIGDTAWKNYTLTFKARRIRGSEGFFMTLYHKDEKNWLKWNIGGWNNTQHALEMRNDGSNSYIAPMVPGVIRDNEWYKVQIKVNGLNIICSLNDTVVHNVKLDQNITYQRVFAVATKDNKSNTVILKMVNPFPYEGKINIDLKNAGKINPVAEEILLTSGNLNDNNSFENPLKVSPKKQNINIPASNFTYTMKPGSLSFIRIKLD